MSCTRRSRFNSSAVPDSVMAPRSMTTARSAIDSATSICCSTISTATPCRAQFFRKSRIGGINACASPSEGSSQSSTAGRATNACASASICCWPPLRVARRGAQLGAQDRKEIEHLARELLEIAAVRANRGAQADIVGHAQLRETRDGRRGSGADPRAHWSSGDCPVMSRPSEHHGAARRLDEARNRPHQRRLAGAVPAEDEHHFARLHRQADAVQHGHAAIARSRDRALQASRLPVNSARTRGSLTISSGAPSAMIAPASSTVIRSATRQTRWRSCSTRMIVLPKRVAQMAQQCREFAPLLLRRGPPPARPAAARRSPSR